MDQSRDLKNIIESTANMQINPESKQHSQKSNAVPMRTQASHFEEVFPEAKRFPYNPYKIMGFQNRETNEFAMNVLKTQMNDQKSNSNVNGSKYSNTESIPKFYIKIIFDLFSVNRQRVSNENEPQSEYSRHSSPTECSRLKVKSIYQYIYSNAI